MFMTSRRKTKKRRTHRGGRPPPPHSMLPPPNVNIGKFWRDWQKKDLSTALYNQQDRPTNPAAVYSVYRPSLSKIEKDAVARKRIRDVGSLNIS